MQQLFLRFLEAEENFFVDLFALNESRRTDAVTKDLLRSVVLVYQVLRVLLQSVELQLQRQLVFYDVGKELVEEAFLLGLPLVQELGRALRLLVLALEHQSLHD